MRLIIVMCFSFCYLMLFGQQKKATFINFTTKDGLNENHTTGITQDSRGFVWLSSVDGITRFDGVNFRKFYPSVLLNDIQSTNNAVVFFQSKPNEIIVTIGNAETYLLNCITPNLKKVQSLKNSRAFDFYRINEQQIIVSSIDTAFLVDNDFEILDTIVVPNEAKGNVLKIRPLDDNRWLVSSWIHHFIYRVKEKKFQKFQLKINKDNLFNSGFEVLHIDLINQWIFVSNYFKGTFKLDFSGNILFNWNNGQPAKFAIAGNTLKIICDPKNNQWLWFLGEGGIAHVNNVNHTTARYAHEPLNDRSILPGGLTSGLVDQSQKIWFGTTHGVSLLNEYSEVLQTFDLQISEDAPLMNIIKAKDGNLYTTKYYDGVFKINLLLEKVVKLPESLNNSWFIFEDGDFLVHGGKGTALNFYHTINQTMVINDDLKKFFDMSSVVVLGLKHSSGDLWFSANNGGGLVRIDAKSKRISHFSKSKGHFSSSYFTQYTEDEKGDLWFSSNKSQIVVHWIKAQNRFEEIDFEKLFANQNNYQSVIHCISSDKNGAIWLGFDGSGLVKYSTHTRKVEIFGARHGLPSNFVYNLVFDHKQRLWIGTKKGLACFKLDEKTFLKFSAENGFPSDMFENSCSFFDAQNHQLWIASNELLLTFKPDKLLSNKKKKISVFIDAFTVNNRQVYFDQLQTFSFSPTENNVQISFTALNFDRSNEVVFSYFLTGAQNEWVDIGTTNSLNFPNLFPGVYEFKLRAKIIGDSQWTYLKNSLHFSIATPWYKTWWFGISVLLSALGFIFFVTRIYYLRKVEKQKATIEKQQAVQNERDRIAYDMHDDLGSGLTKISYLSQMALNKTKEQDELLKINRTSIELVENMSELIWAMKVENDSLQDLVSYLKLYAVEYFDTNSIEISIVIPEIKVDEKLAGESRRNIFLIFKEALHNIVKHSRTEKVNIFIKLQPDFRILIHDFGIGFEPDSEEYTRGNGMKTMRKRCEKLKGKFIIQSSNQGTHLEIIIPWDSLKNQP